MGTTSSLSNLTGQEAGIVIHDEKTAIICNWSSINGIPRLDPLGVAFMGLGEEFPDNLPSVEASGKSILDQLEGMEILSTDPEEDMGFVRESVTDNASCNVYTLSDKVRVVTFSDWR